MKLQRTVRVAAVAAAVLFAAEMFADEVVTLPTRAGVTQSYMLVPPRGASPKVIALMFPGSFGQLHLPTDGTLPQWGRKGNFLVRARDLFRDNDVGVAILDAPSDHQREGLTDGVRLSSEHFTDVQAVVRDLRSRYPGAKIMLVGTSRGTLSAAYVGRAMGPAIDGVIETSSLFTGSGGRGGSSSLGNFDWDAIKVPLLFVHHENDACASCPYTWAKHLTERYPLITVRGGSPPESDPCEAMSAHGYIGKEAETVAAIKGWMLGRPYPHIVE
jgi:dienelactone hydrolase